MDVSELFSPPRLNTLAGEFRVIPGWSADISCRDAFTKRSWDFLKEGDKRAMRALVLKYKPSFLMLCPPCSMFSNLQNMNKSRGTPGWEAEFAEAVDLLRFTCAMAKMQVKARRYFAFEHPLTAASWNESCLVELLNLESVGRVRVDMCRYGLTAEDRGDIGPVLKPTWFASNCPALLQGIGARCECTRPHVHLIGGKAAAAAKYTPALCRAILRCIETQLRWDDEQHRGVHSMFEHDESGGYVHGNFIDDVTGMGINLTPFSRIRPEERRLRK